MSTDAFRTDADISTEPLLAHAGCACALCGRGAARLGGEGGNAGGGVSRRLFTGALLGGALLPAVAQGVREEVGSESAFSRLVPAEEVEAAATQQYKQLLSEAASKRALAPAEHPQVQRLRYIAQRIIPFTDTWNPRARQWKWEVNLIGSKELNAFCMPGGKIAFFYGILQQLQLSDDEVATIMGHEVAHALREHARERMGKSAATQLGAGALSALLGLGNLGNQVLGMGSQLLTLKFSREDESEADIVGMELAARAGYDPAAGVSLWQKMMAVSQGEPLAFMSTHPNSETRIRDIQARLPRVQPLYAQAAKPPQRFGPPAKTGNR
ncbi:M48 family metallopeptidase [Azohydromonas lata]|uniref:M48 family metallopeptidase n=1 Tax=Azohydromonas lata TaxID=45677 RepID=A0ABU5IBB4_9BURK|nr:M48 family metallopeptidase [Azohydromonas lata]MDZ5456394.1 M48 family metallopeptidase [Azohydromonas lata]